MSKARDAIRSAHLRREFEALTMREPTEAQMSRAHAAFEAMSAEWTIRTVSNYGMAHDIYVLEHNPPFTYVDGKQAVDNIAAHKFDGPNAKQQALFMKRDKCLREVLRAVAALTDQPVI